MAHRYRPDSGTAAGCILPAIASGDTTRRAGCNSRGAPLASRKSPQRRADRRDADYFIRTLGIRSAVELHRISQGRFGATVLADGAPIRRRAWAIENARVKPSQPLTGGRSTFPGVAVDGAALDEVLEDAGQSGEATPNRGGLDMLELAQRRLCDMFDLVVHPYLCRHGMSCPRDFITLGLRTDSFEDGVIRPRGRNRVLTRRREHRRDSETSGSNGWPVAHGRLVAAPVTAWERDDRTVAHT